MAKKFIILYLLYYFTSLSQAEEIKFKKIASLSKPWGSTFKNENELIITEKKGKIKIVNINSGEITEVIHNINFRVHGQGGLLYIIHKEDILCGIPAT